MKAFDKLYCDVEVSTYGENPGDIDSLALKDKLLWEIECKKALMESQVRLANRVRDLEDALGGVLNLLDAEQEFTAVKAAHKVLQDRAWTKKTAIDDK